MLRLNNAPQAKVRTNSFSTSLWVCLASHSERCIVIVLCHFNRGSLAPRVSNWPGYAWFSPSTVVTSGLGLGSSQWIVTSPVFSHVGWPTIGADQRHRIWPSWFFFSFLPRIEAGGWWNLDKGSPDHCRQPAWCSLWAQGCLLGGVSCTSACMS